MNKPEKNLSERVAERVLGRQTGKNRTVAVFLALQGDIKMAIDDGWSAKDIWETLRHEGRIHVSYVMFLRYIKRFITKNADDKKTTNNDAPGKSPNKTEPPQPNPTQGIQKNAALEGVKKDENKNTLKKEENVIKEFKWNPHNPNIKDWL
jgi:hypothetical protein